MSTKRRASTGSDSSGTSISDVSVVVRVRPPLQKEVRSFGQSYQSTLTVQENSLRITENIAVISGPFVPDKSLPPQAWAYHDFAFDHVFPETDNQQLVYDEAARSVVQSVLDGYNGTILAYGQTGSGKTFTMEGFDAHGPIQVSTPLDNEDAVRGIIPRAVDDIFKFIAEKTETGTDSFTVQCTYLQIYNETILDLLRPESGHLDIQRESRKRVVVEGLTVVTARGPEDVYRLLRAGQENRVIASTRMNRSSSRSHAIFSMTIRRQTEDGTVTRSKLNLVDLAGSERVRDTGARGQRLEEAAKINLSLSTLGAVIAALTQPGAEGRHIPYRRSKLTRLLEDSLGGNCRTVFLATISPSPDCYAETLSTLQFASRAKLIRNKAHINEDMSDAALLRRCQRELAHLKDACEHITDLESERDMVLRQLEERSREYLSEHQEKIALQERLQMLESRAGGSETEPGSQIALTATQLSRYRELLLRQRDVMIALTHRLSERDETLLQLQQELDSADYASCETRDKLARLSVVAQDLQASVSQVRDVLQQSDRTLAAPDATVARISAVVDARGEALLDERGQLTAAGHDLAAKSLAGSLLSVPRTAHPVLPTPPLSSSGVFSNSFTLSDALISTARPSAAASVAATPQPEDSSVSEACPGSDALSIPPALDMFGAEVTDGSDISLMDDERVADLEAQIVQLKAENQGLRARTAELEEERTELAGHRTRADELTARVTSLEDSLEHAHSDCRALHTILTKKLTPALMEFGSDDPRVLALCRLTLAAAGALERTLGPEQ